MPYLMVIIVVIAAAYLSWRLVQTRLQDAEQHHSPRRPAPRGPDDDPDFLRTLDQR